MSRVFGAVRRQFNCQIRVRRVTTETSDALNWERDKLQMQLQHELTMKRLEIEQTQGREQVAITLKKLELAQGFRTPWCQSRYSKLADSERCMSGSGIQWSLARVTSADRHKSELDIP